MNRSRTHRMGWAGLALVLACRGDARAPSPAATPTPAPAPPTGAQAPPVAAVSLDAAAPPPRPTHRGPHDFACPCRVAGATVAIEERRDAVVLRVTATDPAAIADIQARAAPDLLDTCEMAKEPPGWMTDDCFAGDVDAPCPVLARGARATATAIAAGVEIAMAPGPGWSRAEIAREVRARARSCRAP